MEPVRDLKCHRLEKFGHGVKCFPVVIDIRVGIGFQQRIPFCGRKKRLEVFSLFAWVAVKIRLHANIPIEEACNMGK